MERWTIHERFTATYRDWLNCALIFPARVARAGGLTYLGYLIALIGILLAASELLSDLFKAHITEIERRGEIEPEGAARLFDLLPGFLGILAAPFIVGPAALGARLFHADGAIVLRKLVRESLGAFRAAAAGLVPAIQAAIIAAIPIGAVSLLHDVVLIHFFFTAREAGALVVGCVVLLSPVFARLLPLLTVPVVVVVRNVTARQAVTVAQQTLGPRIVVLTCLWIGGALLAVTVWTLLPSAGITFAASSLGVGIYVATTLSGVSLDGAASVAERRQEAPHRA